MDEIAGCLGIKQDTVYSPTDVALLLRRRAFTRISLPKSGSRPLDFLELGGDNQFRHSRGPNVTASAVVRFIPILR